MLAATASVAHGFRVVLSLSLFVDLLWSGSRAVTLYVFPSIMFVMLLTQTESKKKLDFCRTYVETY